MCVITIKPAGIQINSLDLADMWRHNSDGASVAFIKDNRHFYIKGLMKYEGLKHVVSKLSRYELIIHFRYATHGPINKRLTHPFLLRDTVKESIGEATGKLASTTDNLLFHNGVISGFGSQKISDTVEFTAKVLANIADINTKVRLLENVGGSYALLYNGLLYTVGDFETYGELLVSNTHWASFYGKDEYDREVMF